MATAEFIARMEACCGKRINPRAFDVQPCGHRLVVVLDKVPERYGLIMLPQNNNDPGGGAGWVIAVGPDVGKGTPHPGGPFLTGEELLGQHIIFGGYIGKPLKFSFLDSKLDARVIIMSDRDVWAIDANPEEAARETQDTAAGE